MYVYNITEGVGVVFTVKPVRKSAMDSGNFHSYN